MRLWRWPTTRPERPRHAVHADQHPDAFEHEDRQVELAGQRDQHAARTEQVEQLVDQAGAVQAPVERIIFEVISAFATVGLSSGLAADMPPSGQLVLVFVMYVGRVGTIALATAIAVRSRHSPIRYPEEKPIVG